MLRQRTHGDASPPDGEVRTYLIKQKVKGIKKYPLIMELEPLFADSPKCAGRGKIQPAAPTVALS